MTQHSLLIGDLGYVKATPCRLSCGVVDPSAVALRRIPHRSLIRPFLDLAARLLALAPRVLALRGREQALALDRGDRAHAVLAAGDAVHRFGHPYAARGELPLCCSAWAAARLASASWRSRARATRRSSSCL